MSTGALLEVGLREPQSTFEQAAPKSHSPPVVTTGSDRQRRKVDALQCIQISKFLAFLTFEKITRTVDVERKKREETENEH
jgi:hypothetical protein